MILRTLGSLAGITLAYAALPLDVAQRSTLIGLLGGLGFVLVGLAGFVVLLRFQFRSAATRGAPVLAAAERLLFTLYLLVFFFAIGRPSYWESVCHYLLITGVDV